MRPQHFTNKLTFEAEEQGFLLTVVQAGCHFSLLMTLHINERGSAVRVLNYAMLHFQHWQKVEEHKIFLGLFHLNQTILVLLINLDTIFSISDTPFFLDIRYTVYHLK